MISANGGGVGFNTATNNVIQGNLIGTDITGTKPLGNNGPGISLSDSGDNTIGGAARGAGNVISANNADGILTTSEILGDNLIQGNKIGTDITGTKPLGNSANGIDLFDESGNTVGGTTPAAANVISANGQDGITTGPFFGNNNLIEGNFIGTNATGAKDLGNGGVGVYVQDSDNTIGGTMRGAGNVIAYNGQAGVAVVDNFNGLTTGVEILSNSIFANQGLGIDLNDDGVTPNHPGGPVYGPNYLQNYSVLTSALDGAGKTTISGTLNSAADTSYLIQLFADPTADPSGYGQGQFLIGSITVTTDANGNASFTATYSPTVPAGWYVSATATDPTGDTSEFAQDVQVTRARPSGSSAAPAVSSVSIAPLTSPAAAVKTAGTGQASPVSDAALEAMARELVLLRQRRMIGVANSSKPSPASL